MEKALIAVAAPGSGLADVRHDSPPAVAGTLRRIARHPLRFLVLGWNWKSAASSALFRGIVFFASMAAVGWGAAAEAVGVEVVLRLAVSGSLGAVTETLRHAQPRWAARLWVVGILPAVGNLASFAAHWATDSPGVYWGTIASVAMSAIAAAFNLFAMRRGVLLVGSGRQSFGRDLAAIPSLIGRFLALPALAVMRLLRSTP